MTVAPLDERESAAVGFVLSRWFAVLASAAFGLFFFGFATKWTFDPWTIGTFWPGHFFSAQADAMLHGRLWIDRTDLPGECVFVDGRCTGYFGLAPSVVRLPLVLLLGVSRSEMTGLFLAIAAAVALWGALDLCRRVVERQGHGGDGWSAGYVLVAAVVLGPGGVLMLVSDPYVYQEAILWSVAATVIGVNLFWRWWIERRDRQFVGATLALVVAAASRPTAALVGLVLAVAVIGACVRARRMSRRATLGSLAIAFLPGLVMVAGFFAKFGEPLPPAEGYEGLDYVYVARIIENNGGEFGTSARFLPTALFAYMRPDTLQLSSGWPPVGFRFGRPFGNEDKERITYLPPLAQDSINVERNVSLTNVMPLPLAATVAATVMIVRRRRQRFELAILAALATLPLIMFTTQTIASRYLGDFFPLVAVGTAFGAPLVGSLRRTRWITQYVVFLAVVILSAVSVPVVLSLASQYNWIYRGGIK